MAYQVRPRRPARLSAARESSPDARDRGTTTARRTVREGEKKKRAARKAAAPPTPARPAQTPDSKKEEFRKYLEKSGVIDALTKVLVGLYEEPERPPNAVDYIKRYMGAPTGIDVEALRQENENVRRGRVPTRL